MMTRGNDSCGGTRSLVVVFGDQLDLNAPALQEADPRQDAILMMEVEGESRHVPSHRQRTALFLSAMRHFAARVRERGLQLRYVAIDDGDNTQGFETEFGRAIAHFQPARLVATRPGEWRVLESLERAARAAAVPLTILADRHFLCSIEDFATWARGKRELVLEHFYRWQRKRLGILIDERGGPTGGAWNFDKDNRESFRSAPRPPAPWRPALDETTREVLRLVSSRLAALPGRLDDFPWPVTREDALRVLDDFIANRLPLFGRFQDAMWSGERYLYHSLLSPALNLRLLDPRECVARAVEAYERGDAPLAAVEGFVRQIIGWREFIRGVYWLMGPDYRRRNALGEHGALPEFYWTGDTEMACLRDALLQVLDIGYGHHIQRLMITGNFALIAGIDPRAVSDWYLGMYVDAVDWVTLPNTLGMTMHADGGVVGTKPYAASGKYVQRMSNYCEKCRFDVSLRSGPDACPFNVFYWDFLLRHERRFRSNRRMGPVLSHLPRMSGDERAAIQQDADRLRRAFGITTHGDP